MLELTKLPAYYIEKYGREKVSEVTGNDNKMVAMWLSRGAFPLVAVEALLAFDPGPLHAIRPLYEKEPIAGGLAILMPLAGGPKKQAMDCLVKLHDPKEMTFLSRSFNGLSVVRNMLAASWLNGPWPWAFWLDSDMLTPCGDAEYFKRESELPDLPDAYAGMHTIYRLLAHKLKRGIDARVVGVSYVSKKRGAVPQFGGGDEMRADLRRGPRDALKEVPWIGFGGVLTHRTVFEDIIKTQGDEIRMKPGGIGDRFGYKYAFFHPTDIETPGDDLPACRRMTRAGHKIYVDLSLAASHIGDRAYTFRDIA